MKRKQWTEQEMEWLRDSAAASDESIEEKMLQDASELCMCGSVGDGQSGLLRILSAITGYDSLLTVIQDKEICTAVYWLLDAMHWTEHGTSVHGCWLTERGKQIKDLLEKVTSEEHAMGHEEER